MRQAIALACMVTLLAATTGCLGLGGSKNTNANAEETPEECKGYQVRDGDFMWAYNGKDRESNTDSKPWFNDDRQVVIEVCPYITYGTFHLTLKDATGNTVFDQTFRRSDDKATFNIHGNPGGWIVGLEWEGYTGHMTIHVYGKPQ